MLKKLSHRLLVLHISTSLFQRHYFNLPLASHVHPQKLFLLIYETTERLNQLRLVTSPSFMKRANLQQSHKIKTINWDNNPGKKKKERKTYKRSSTTQSNNIHKQVTTERFINFVGKV